MDNHDPDTCERYPMCFVQAGLTEFAEMASFFWVGCIAFNIYAIAVLRMNERRVNLQHMYYHIFSWGVPVILTVIGFIGDYYGAWSCGRAARYSRPGVAYGIRLDMHSGIHFLANCVIQRGRWWHSNSV